MREEARAAFLPFTKPLEGVCPWMYLDVKGLVTTAIGDLIDTPDEALSLPWLRSDGSPATRREIAGEWSYVKSRQDMRLGGGGAFAAVTYLRLDDDGVAQVVGRTLDRMDHQLATRFPEYEDWPWQAQLATLSMAWACGAAFHFPHLEAALLAQDFARASAECTIREEGNPGVIPRNRGNRALYLEAAEDVATAPKVNGPDVALGAAAIDDLQRAVSRTGR